jgi:hypothetical protein
VIINRLGEMDQRAGALHWASQLSENDVRDIRERARGGCRQIILAREYEVSACTISLIVNRLAWKHVK